MQRPLSQNEARRNSLLLHCARLYISAVPLYHPPRRPDVIEAITNACVSNMNACAFRNGKAMGLMEVIQDCSQSLSILIPTTEILALTSMYCIHRVYYRRERQQRKFLWLCNNHFERLLSTKFVTTNRWLRVMKYNTICLKPKVSSAKKFRANSVRNFFWHVGINDNKMSEKTSYNTNYIKKIFLFITLSQRNDDIVIFIKIDYLLNFSFFFLVKITRKECWNKIKLY